MLPYYNYNSKVKYATHRDLPYAMEIKLPI